MRKVKALHSKEQSVRLLQSSFCLRCSVRWPRETSPSLSICFCAGRAGDKQPVSCFTAFHPTIHAFKWVSLM